MGKNFVKIFQTLYPLSCLKTAKNFPCFFLSPAVDVYDFFRVCKVKYIWNNFCYLLDDVFTSFSQKPTTTGAAIFCAHLSTLTSLRAVYANFVMSWNRKKPTKVAIEIKNQLHIGHVCRGKFLEY